jgi:hypothetical protein
MKEHRIVGICAALLLIVCGIGVARAQTAPTVTLSATPPSGPGSVTPVLTWSSTNAVSCTASGGWSGTKQTSGTETLAPITATASYTLTCAGVADSKVTVAWVAPTQNTDDSPLTDLAGFRILWGRSATVLDQTTYLQDPTARTWVKDQFTPGTWYFSVRPFNAGGFEAADSNIASKVIGAAPTAAKTASVTVFKVPKPATLVTVAQAVYDVRPNESTFAFDRGRQVGSVKLGAACDEQRTTGADFFALERPSTAILTRPARSSALVAQCREKASSPTLSPIASFRDGRRVLMGASGDQAS